MSQSELPRAGRQTWLIEWDPKDGHPALLGHAAVRFPSGQRTHEIAVFKPRSLGAPLGVKVPTVSKLKPDGTREWAEIISFDDDATKDRWIEQVRLALADAGIGEGGDR